MLSLSRNARIDVGREGVGGGSIGKTQGVERAEESIGGFGCGSGREDKVDDALVRFAEELWKRGHANGVSQLGSRWVGVSKRLMRAGRTSSDRSLMNLWSSRDMRWTSRRQSTPGSKHVDVEVELSSVNNQTLSSCSLLNRTLGPEGHANKVA